MTIRIKTVRSGIAVMAVSLGVQLLKVVSMVVLARLLEPDDFGLVSLAAVLIGATELFSGMGMGSAVIASKEESSKAAYHGVRITVVTGIVFMFLAIAVAPIVAQWFGNTQLRAVIQWMSVLILFQTLSIVPNAVLMKEMMFGRLVIPRTLSPLSNVVVAIAMAYGGYGFWSLVAGQIVGGVVGLASSLAVCPSVGWLKPQKWDISLTKELSRFGLTNMGTGIVQYVYNQGDYVVVGKVLGMTPLGFYTQAYNLANLPVNTISRVANTVLFPAYARIRDDANRLAGAFLESFRMVSVLSVPMAVGLLILAPDLVIFLIGEKWRNSIPILQAFSILSLVRPLSGTTSPLFLAVNRPGYNFRTAVIQCVTMFSLIWPFLRWGAPGVALGVVTAFVIGLVYNIYLVCWRTGLPIRVGDLLTRVAPAVLASVVMAGVVVGLRQPLLDLMGGTHNVLSLVALVLSGILCYTLVLLALDRRIVLDIVGILSSVVRPTRGRGETTGAATPPPGDSVVNK